MRPPRRMAAAIFRRPYCTCVCIDYTQKPGPTHVQRTSSWFWQVWYLMEPFEALPATPVAFEGGGCVLLLDSYHAHNKTTVILNSKRSLLIELATVYIQREVANNTGNLIEGQAKLISDVMPKIPNRDEA